MIKIGISFKETGDDIEVLEYLRKKAKIIGTSAYIKQLIYEKMLEDRKREK